MDTHDASAAGSSTTKSAPDSGPEWDTFDPVNAPVCRRLRDPETSLAQAFWAVHAELKGLVNEAAFPQVAEARGAMLKAWEELGVPGAQDLVDLMLRQTMLKVLADRLPSSAGEKLHKTMKSRGAEVDQNSDLSMKVYAAEMARALEGISLDALPAAQAGAPMLDRVKQLIGEAGLSKGGRQESLDVVGKIVSMTAPANDPVLIAYGQLLGQLEKLGLSAEEGRTVVLAILARDAAVQQPDAPYRKRCREQIDDLLGRITRGEQSSWMAPAVEALGRALVEPKIPQEELRAECVGKCGDAFGAPAYQKMLREIESAVSSGRPIQDAQGGSPVKDFVISHLGRINHAGAPLEDMKWIFHAGVGVLSKLHSLLGELHASAEQRREIFSELNKALKEKVKPLTMQPDFMGKFVPSTHQAFWATHRETCKAAFEALRNAVNSIRDESGNVDLLAMGQAAWNALHTAFQPLVGRPADLTIAINAVVASAGFQLRFFPEQGGMLSAVAQRLIETLSGSAKPGSAVDGPASPEPATQQSRVPPSAREMETRLRRSPLGAFVGIPLRQMSLVLMPLYRMMTPDDALAKAHEELVSALPANLAPSVRDSAIRMAVLDLLDQQIPYKPSARKLIDELRKVELRLASDSPEPEDAARARLLVHQVCSAVTSIAPYDQELPQDERLPHQLYYAARDTTPATSIRNPATPLKTALEVLNYAYAGRGPGGHLEAEFETCKKSLMQTAKDAPKPVWLVSAALKQVMLDAVLSRLSDPMERAEFKERFEGLKQTFEKTGDHTAYTSAALNYLRTCMQRHQQQPYQTGAAISVPFLGDLSNGQYHALFMASLYFRNMGTLLCKARDAYKFSASLDEEMTPLLQKVASEVEAWGLGAWTGKAEALERAEVQKAMILAYLGDELQCCPGLQPGLAALVRDRCTALLDKSIAVIQRRPALQVQDSGLATLSSSAKPSSAVLGEPLTAVLWRLCEEGMTEQIKSDLQSARLLALSHTWIHLQASGKYPEGHPAETVAQEMQKLGMPQDKIDMLKEWVRHKANLAARMQEPLPTFANSRKDDPILSDNKKFA